MLRAEDDLISAVPPQTSLTSLESKVQINFEEVVEEPVLRGKGMEMRGRRQRSTGTPCHLHEREPYENKTKNWQLRLNHPHLQPQECDC